MARKITISKDYLVNTAFQMVKQEGIEQVTARKLASKAECSTQPIFRSYENMEELYQELFRMANSFFAFYYERFPKEQKEPFINLAYAYIQFAKEEKHLFRFLFLPNRSYGKSTYEILNGEKGLLWQSLKRQIRMAVKMSAICLQSCGFLYMVRHAWR